MTHTPAMSRNTRIAPGGYIFHVLNRANARAPLFSAPGDYAAFAQLLRDARERVPLRILSYCLMPNHWHLVVWPEKDGQLPDFMFWLTTTHARRWHLYRGSTGNGHVYQGRYKSFPVESNEHFLTVCRYVERNSLRANLVTRAEQWRWSSLWQRMHPAGSEVSASDWLSRWPVPTPADWVEWVNRPQSRAELEALRVSVNRGRPFGNAGWRTETVSRMNLSATLQPIGRPTLAG